MHLTEGEIQAYWDQELPAEERERVSEHLAGCEACRGQAAALHARSLRIQAHLETLSPPHRLLSSQSARLRLADRLQPLEKENQNMFRTLFNRLPRPVWAVLAVVVLLAVSMQFAPVRAIANSFLGLFRVQQISVVEVDPEAIASSLDSDQFEALMNTDFQIEPTGKVQDVASPEEAAQAAGYPVRLPAIEGKGLELQVQPGGKASFQVDLKRIQALLDEIGRSDVRLPQGIDGAQVTLTASPAVMARYGACRSNQNRHPGGDPDLRFDPDIPLRGDCTTFLQMPSPEVDAPEGLDVQALGTAYLQMLGLSQADAQAFASNVDWTTTLVVPVPGDEVVYREVSVDGVTGTLLLEKVPARSLGHYALIWVKDGIVYALEGQGDEATAVQYANSLQ